MALPYCEDLPPAGGKCFSPAGDERVPRGTVSAWKNETCRKIIEITASGFASLNVSEYDVLRIVMNAS